MGRHTLSAAQNSTVRYEGEEASAVGVGRLNWEEVTRRSLRVLWPVDAWHRPEESRGLPESPIRRPRLPIPSAGFLGCASITVPQVGWPWKTPT